MRVWELSAGYGIDNLRLVERAEPVAEPGQVVLEMCAASLNYRDLLKVEQGGDSLPLVPLSDGAGIVRSVGEGVTRVVPGDRVCPMFFQGWVDGPPTAERRSRPLGGPLDGVLQGYLRVDAEGVAAVPAQWSDVEAATLPCAGLTAWRALVVEGGLAAGDTVLVQGTGGVATFALQFAKMLGARVIATSSSDAKLERARELGADELINYRQTPDWGRAVRELTDGRGVDHVIEVGGKDTLNQSLEAVCVGGKVLIIGVLSGFSQEIAIPRIFTQNLRLIGLSVGSRSHFEQMTAAIERHDMKPVIDSVWPFERVPDALRHMRSADHYGKIVIAY